MNFAIILLQLCFWLSNGKAVTPKPRILSPYPGNRKKKSWFRSPKTFLSHPLRLQHC
nr:MAG TPA: hypothetical protein [Caudoviricetes sp.]